MYVFNISYNNQSVATSMRYIQIEVKQGVEIQANIREIVSVVRSRDRRK